MKESNKHLYKYNGEGRRIKALVDLTCPVCYVVFSPRVSGAKYCSRECYYKMKSIRGDRVHWTSEMRNKMSRRYRGKGNPTYGLVSHWKGKKRPEISGNNHPNWKGGYITKDGYRSISVDGKDIGEHRYIMQKHLNRKLLTGEVVHHKNGDKLDNRIDNLEVMTRKEHIEFHRKDLR